jgi:dolichyl-phosphate beta-glucosyltransferase
MDTREVIEALDAGAEMAIGSRSLASRRSDFTVDARWHRSVLGSCFNMIVRVGGIRGITDTQCGFKAFNLVKFRPLLDLMKIDRFGFDVEFLFVANYHHLRLKEIAVRWNDVAGSKVSVFRDTRRMVSELAEIRRNAKNGAHNVS